MDKIYGILGRRRFGGRDVKREIYMTHFLQEFILKGVLVGKGYSPKMAYETV